jgi:hypothetical protein
MGSAMHTIAQALPLTHVTESIRNPWLGLGTGTTHLLVVAAVLAATALGWRRAVKL